MTPPAPAHTSTAGSAPLSPLIHLIDDDAAVRDSLALLIGTVGLRVQTWADPLAFVEALKDLSAPRREQESGHRTRLR